MNQSKGGPQKRTPSNRHGSASSRNRNQRRRYNQNRSENDKSEKKGDSYKNRRGHRSYSKGGNYRSQHSRLSPLESLVKRYGKCLDLHLAARKKHHDLFYKADPQQKAKLEKNYYQTLDNLRKFEETLKPEDKELFLKNFKELNPDQTYSLNHNLPLKDEETSSSEPKVDDSIEIEDPHLLMSQTQQSFSDDVEESVGSIEDYKRLKGL